MGMTGPAMRERRGDAERTHGYERDGHASGGSAERARRPSPEQHAADARGLIGEMHEALGRAQEAVPAVVDAGDDVAAHRAARVVVESALQSAQGALDRARPLARLAGDAALAVELDAATTALTVGRIAVLGRLPDEPQPFRMVSNESELVAIVEADHSDVGARDGFARKEDQLRAAFAALSPADCEALRQRLARPAAAGDRFAVAVQRFTGERQAALRSFLAGARAREARRLLVAAASTTTAHATCTATVNDAGAHEPQPDADAQAVRADHEPAAATTVQASQRAAAPTSEQRAAADRFLDAIVGSWTVSPRPLLLSGPLEQRTVAIDTRAPAPPLGAPPVSIRWSVRGAEESAPVAQGTAVWAPLMPLPPLMFESVLREGAYQVSLAVDVEGHSTVRESIAFTARRATKDAATGLSDAAVMRDRSDLRQRLATELDSGERATLLEGYNALLAASASRGLPSIAQEDWRTGTATTPEEHAPGDPAGARAYVERVVARDGLRNGRVDLTLGAWSFGDPAQQHALMAQVALVEDEARAFRGVFRTETLAATQALLNQSERQLGQALHAYGLAPFSSAVATSARTVAHDEATLDTQTEHLLRAAKVGRDDGPGYAAHAGDRAQLGAVAQALAARQAHVRQVAEEHAHLLTTLDEARFEARGGAGPDAARQHPTHHGRRESLRQQLARLPSAPGPTLRGAQPAPAPAGAVSDQEQLVAAHLAATAAELRRAQLALRTDWIEAERAHPILVAFRREGGRDADLAPLSGGDDDSMRAVLRTVLPKLGNVYKCEAWLAAGKLDPLKLQPAVAIARDRLDVAPGSVRDAVARELVAEADESWQAWALAAVTLAMAVVAVVPTGGSSLAVGLELAGLALDAYLSIDAVGDYATDSATANTALDPAVALSQEEPSLTWLAVQLVGSGVGAAFAVKTFRDAVAVHRAAATGKASQAAIRALDEIGEREGLGAIGTRVVEGMDADSARNASRGHESGPALDAKEALEGTGVSQGHAHHGPGYVSELVDGVYDVPDELPPGWRTYDPPISYRGRDMELMTMFWAPNGGYGRLEQVWNRETGTLTMKAAFFENSPGWIDSAVPLVPGQGTPLYAYLSMRQMRLVNIELGQIRHVVLSKIQDVKALAQLEDLRRRHVPLDIAVRKTHTFRFAETPIVQSGHQVVAARVEGGYEAPFEKLLHHYEKDAPDKRALHDAILAEYGIARQDSIFMDYTVHLDLSPTVARIEDDL
jgi:hypothetical protein